MGWGSGSEVRDVKVVEGWEVVLEEGVVGECWSTKVADGVAGPGKIHAGNMPVGLCLVSSGEWCVVEVTWQRDGIIQCVF